MNLEELRAALETAKLALAEGDKPDAVARNLIDWCEGVQVFLEQVHGSSSDECMVCKGDRYTDSEGVARPCPNCGA